MPSVLNSVALTVYKIDYIAAAKKPEEDLNLRPPAPEPGVIKIR